jgi:hypothetical protein
MAYFPKHYIKANQYTNGGEFVYKGTSTPYVGPYFQTGNNKFFTGNTPQSPNIFEIIPNLPTTISIPEGITPIEYAFRMDLSEELGDTFPTFDDLEGIDTLNYMKAKSIAFSPLGLKIIPPYSPNIPTSQDYQNGEFRRYFCKKTNQSLYIEISFEIYSALKNKSPLLEWALYIPFNIPWQLTGTKEKVAEINKNITLLAMKNQKLPSFDQYLKFDWTKYYQ